MSKHDARNEEIARRYQAGEAAKVLARDYNLTPEYINRLMHHLDIKHGRTCLRRNGKRERIDIYGETGKQLREYSGKTFKPMSLVVHEALKMYFRSLER